MKKIVTFILFTFWGLNAWGQQAVDLRKKIFVSGNAEKEVTPDIIYINFSLKEYFENGKSGKKTNITTLEKQLYDAVQKAGISKDNLTVGNLSSWNYSIERKKNPEFLASKQYRLKLNNLNKFDAIIADIDPKGINSTDIDRYDYSKIDSLKKDLKIKALLAAQQKANYMVEALGNKLGGVLEIQDNKENNTHFLYKDRSYGMNIAVGSDASAPDINFKTIILNYTVNVVFEIK